MPVVILFPLAPCLHLATARTADLPPASLAVPSVSVSLLSFISPTSKAGVPQAQALVLFTLLSHTLL